MNHDDFLYKHLQISSEQLNCITEEIQQYHSKVKSNNLKTQYYSSDNVFTTNTSDVLLNCKTLLQYILSLKCGTISGIKFIYAFVNDPQYPHIDHVTEDGKLATESYLALNFPVKNCHDTEVRFCEPVGKINQELRYLGTGYRARFAIHDQWIVVDRYQLTGPTLVNTNRYHQIVNETLKDRISLSVRFKKNPWHLVAN